MRSADLVKVLDDHFNVPCTSIVLAEKGKTSILTSQAAKPGTAPFLATRFSHF